jgi:hypothetical protein
MRFYLRPSISNLLIVHQISFGLLKFFNQLFKAEQNRLSQSNCQEHEKDCVNDQATDIKCFVFDFDKHDKLIIVHRHAESTVDPTYHSGLSRLSLHPSQLDKVEDILCEEDTD